MSTDEENDEGIVCGDPAVKKSNKTIKSIIEDNPGQKALIDGEYYIIGMIYKPRDKKKANAEPRKLVRVETTLWSQWVFYDSDRLLYGANFTKKISPSTWRQWSDPKSGTEDRQPLPSESVHKPEPHNVTKKMAPRSVEPKVAMSPCYRCRRSVPRHELVSQRMPRGARGRRHSGYVLMCSSCASQQQGENWTVAIIMLVVFVLVGLLFFALGIPLTKPLNKAH